VSSEVTGMVEKFRMTAAEFFELPETNQIIELINGELIVSPPPILDHQRLVFKFGKLIESLMPDGEVFVAPVGVYLDEDNVPEPDVVWVSAHSRCVLTKKRIEGPPDLIVEVLSPGTERQDRKEKFEIYQRFGVREFWMADPEEQFLEVYRLENGVFVRQGVYGPEESFESAVLGKTVDLKGIFRE